MIPLKSFHSDRSFLVLIKYTLTAKSGSINEPNSRRLGIMITNGIKHSKDGIPYHSIHGSIFFFLRLFLTTLSNGVDIKYRKNQPIKKTTCSPLGLDKKMPSNVGRRNMAHEPCSFGKIIFVFAIVITLSLDCPAIYRLL